MKEFNVVLLTAEKYSDHANSSPLVQNVLQENHLVAQALQKIGLQTAMKSWSDPKFDWSTTEYILIRTPWDYFERFEEFLLWFKKTANVTVFINSAQLIHWNIDKNYLKELQANGIRLPNTYFVPKGTTLELQEAMALAEEQFGSQCTTWVLKPCIAAGAYNTFRFDQDESEEYANRFKALIENADFMLQEFQHNIVDKGEISLMLINGEFSHAVLKRAKTGDFRVQDDYGGTVEPYHPSEAEINFSKEVVEACKEMPLYARVDILRDNMERLALAELEIFEPELWFRFRPESADILAKALKENYFS